jgi:hypothetical protein
MGNGNPTPIPTFPLRGKEKRFFLLPIPYFLFPISYFLFPDIGGLTDIR